MKYIADLEAVKVCKKNTRSVDLRQAQRSFGAIPNITKQNTKLSKSFDKTKSQLRGVKSKMVATYSDIEYLCKDINGSKAVNWAVSLRKKVPLLNLTKSQPPSFWDDDMERWKKRFQLTNTQELNDIKHIRDSYYVCFHERPKILSLSKFSINDSILLRGNASPVSIL